MFGPRDRQGFRRLYNWYHRFYGSVERAAGPTLDVIVEQYLKPLGNLKTKMALEHACGSGLLTLKLAPLFGAVTARDLSVGMLDRARRRAAAAGVHGVSFQEGDLLDPGEPEKSYDYVFVSFALHLYGPDTVVGILRRLGRIAREGLWVVDHGRTWRWGTALVERLEGSHYAVFIRMDFAAAARDADLVLAGEHVVGDFMVLLFLPRR